MNHNSPTTSPEPVWPVATESGPAGGPTKPRRSGAPGSSSSGWILLLAVLAVAAFHAGFLIEPLWWLVLVWLGCLFALRRTSCGRWAFYTGLAIGLGIYIPQLYFFWGIFGPAAVALWLVLGFWLALFLLMLHGVDRYWGMWAAVALAPVLWLGTEFFRSELYYLRFSWFTAGSFLSLTEWSGAFARLGVYGLGAALMLVSALVFAAIESCIRREWKVFVALIASVTVAGGMGLMTAQRQSPEAAEGPPWSAHLAGVQLGCPKVAEVLLHLDRLVAERSKTDLILLGEYTFDGPPPEDVRAWCRHHARWLVAGGKEPLEDGGFYNTAFVVSPEGEIVFQQAKSVPMQFFDDGQPAPAQDVWCWDPPLTHASRDEARASVPARGDRDSNGQVRRPLHVGMAVCYDLSYARVMDRLFTGKGPNPVVPDLVLVPAMDALDWGRHQHRLNARMTPIRAAEYRRWIFRVATSGYSQLVAPGGRVIAEAGTPGQGDIIAGTAHGPGHPRVNVPPDRALGFLAVIATVIVMVWLGFEQRRVCRQPTSSEY